MNNLLEDIINKKQAMLNNRKKERPFYQALKQPGLSIIAEIKRQSPTRGPLDPHLQPIHLAQSYLSGGADAISILTEEHYFKGKVDDLISVKHATNSVILRKDFIISTEQIIESVHLGADAILLIMAILSQKEAKQLFDFAKACQLDVLVETHNEQEIKRALAIGADIIGINNRDLTTFTVSIDTSFGLIESLPKSVVTVSESGITTIEQAQALYHAGFDALLIGESLITDPNCQNKIQSLKQLEPLS
jgi:indole-3-glycerol phosphate synthase